MCFSAAPSSEKDQGSMNFASNTAPGLLDHAVEGGRHPAEHRMAQLALDVCDALSGVDLVPASVQSLGGAAELDDEIAGQVLGFGLAAFLAPEAEEGGSSCP